MDAAGGLILLSILILLAKEPSASIRIGHPLFLAVATCLALPLLALVPGGLRAWCVPGCQDVPLHADWALPCSRPCCCAPTSRGFPHQPAAPCACGCPLHPCRYVRRREQVLLLFFVVALSYQQAASNHLDSHVSKARHLCMHARLAAAARAAIAAGPAGERGAAAV